MIALLFLGVAALGVSVGLLLHTWCPRRYPVIWHRVGPPTNYGVPGDEHGYHLEPPAPVDEDELVLRSMGVSCSCHPEGAPLPGGPSAHPEDDRDWLRLKYETCRVHGTR